MKKLFIPILLIIMGLLTITLIFYQRQGKLSLSLEGRTSISLYIGESYIEEGFKAYDTKEGDLSKKVNIKDQTDYQKEGTYQRIYTIQNKKGKTEKAIRTIRIQKEKILTWQEKYDKIDNQKKGWWSGNKKDGTRPTGGETAEILKPYNAYFIGPDTKTIYLTFDEGANDTYLDEIVDILNNNNIKATFFLCKRFILDNPETIRKLAKTGHSVGNHTAQHHTMSLYAEKDSFSTYLEQIKDVEKAYTSVTGQRMDKVYREPRGDWSFRSLAIAKDLGYKSFFWSADYLDWGRVITKDIAFNELTKRVHNGAIYLIHPRNKANYEVMDSFIKYLKKKGYSFDLVKNII